MLFMLVAATGTFAPQIVNATSATTYTRTTNASGYMSMNINLPPKPDGYIITAENPNSTERYTNVII